MKKFLLNFIIFSLIILVIIVIFSVLPATPYQKSSLLFAKIDKDKLLKNTPSPRIIFIGGSNLSFGLNSQTIKDSLNYNPINTGVHAAIGLMYMLDHTLPFIKRGDVVVIIPEYQQYLNRLAYGQEELLRTVLDVPGNKDITKLSLNQVYNLAPYFLKVIFSKVQITRTTKFNRDPIYSRNSFNKYGDVNAHWNLPAVKVQPVFFTGTINYDVFIKLKNYQATLKKIGATMYVSFPGCQYSSFNNSRSNIDTIEKLLVKNRFDILGTPQRYAMADSLIYNSRYHLTRHGVDKRTGLLIQDLKKARTINN